MEWGPMYGVRVGRSLASANAHEQLCACTLETAKGLYPGQRQGPSGLPGKSSLRSMILKGPVQCCKNMEWQQDAPGDSCLPVAMNGSSATLSEY